MTVPCRTPTPTHPYLQSPANLGFIPSGSLDAVVCIRSVSGAGESAEARAKVVAVSAAGCVPEAMPELMCAAPQCCCLEPWTLRGWRWQCTRCFHLLGFDSRATERPWWRWWLRDAQLSWFLELGWACACQ